MKDKLTRTTHKHYHPKKVIVYWTASIRTNDLGGSYVIAEHTNIAILKAKFPNCEYKPIYS